MWPIFPTHQVLLRKMLPCLIQTHHAIAFYDSQEHNINNHLGFAITEDLNEMVRDDFKINFRLKVFWSLKKKKTILITESTWPTTSIEIRLVRWILFGKWKFKVETGWKEWETQSMPWRLKISKWTADFNVPDAIISLFNITVQSSDIIFCL